MSASMIQSASPGSRPGPVSLGRLALALVVVIGVSGGGVAGLRHRFDEPPPRAETWYAPYVDVTLTPQYAFEDPSVNTVDDVVLGFVVADPDDGCTPSWGGVYDLDAAATGLDLDRRIARYREHDGDVIVSFGGARNDELATTCSDPSDLATAYRDVVERYDVTTIDLDLEGPALTDQASIARRAEAVATVQAATREAGRALTVWLTLPVSPSGLAESGVAVVDAMLAAGVDLGGVNAMTMNYGGSRDAARPMADAAAGALEGARQQLGEAYRRAGTPQDDAQLWGKLGATPMIGVNDEDGEVTTLDDARALRALATERGLGRVSMWSANRDTACAGDVEPSEPSNHCSGVDQSPRTFSHVLDALTGRPGATADRRTVASPPAVDDPDASPYPVWEAEGIYDEGDKVVRHGEVFVAQWWTQGDDPGTGSTPGAAAPWRLVGPVLASDRRPTPSTLPAGTHPEWDPAAVYTEGDRVLVDGVGYEALWWTQGDEPGAAPRGQGPWEPMADGG